MIHNITKSIEKQSMRIPSIETRLRLRIWPDPIRHKNGKFMFIHSHSVLESIIYKTLHFLERTQRTDRSSKKFPGTN